MSACPTPMDLNMAPSVEVNCLACNSLSPKASAAFFAHSSILTEPSPKVVSTTFWTSFRSDATPMAALPNSMICLVTKAEPMTFAIFAAVVDTVLSAPSMVSLTVPSNCPPVFLASFSNSSSAFNACELSPSILYTTLPSSPTLFTCLCVSHHLFGDIL